MDESADQEIVALLRSIRRWMLVSVILLGVLLVALASIGYEVSGATDGALYAAIGVTGAFMALVAGLRTLLSLFSGTPKTTTKSSSETE